MLPISRRTLLLLCFCAAVEPALVSGDEEKPAAGPDPIRVLIIGNSQLYFNNFPDILEKLSESAPQDRRRIKTGRALNGGYTLEKHWTDGDGKGTARGKIAEGKWDFVVLQEWGGTADPAKTVEYTRLFHDLIRQRGARTVLVSHAHFPAKYPQGFVDLHAQFLTLARELKVPLASGSKAWIAYLGDKPTEQQVLELFHPDKGHPGPKGSYLYACTLYGTIMGKSPVGISTIVHGSHGAPTTQITDAEAKRFADAAWKTCQELSEGK